MTGNMSEPKALQNLDEKNSWQKYCTAALLDTIKLPEHQRAAAWSDTHKSLFKLARRLISDPREQRVIIADVNLKNQRLKAFDFSYCYVIRTDLRGTDLRDSNFSYAIIRDSSLNDANVNGANFSSTGIKDTYVQNLHYNSRTRLNFARFEPSGFVSPQLQDRIDHDRFVVSTRNASVPIRFLNLLTGYGSGFRRFLLLCVGVIFLFAFGYSRIAPEDFAIGAGTLTPETLSFWNFLLFSAERFLNASPWIYGVSSLTHFLSTLETLVGLFCLGILVAMLIKQVLRS